MVFSLYPLWRKTMRCFRPFGSLAIARRSRNGGASLAKLFCPVKTAVVAAFIKVTVPFACFSLAG
jgi:hypothetical protein